jgi:hypothetical protein
MQHLATDIPKDRRQALTRNVAPIDEIAEVGYRPTRPVIESWLGDRTASGNPG